MGHPVLLRRADVVADPTDPEIARLAADMIETMLDAGGLGLAGPQVHVPLRIFVMQLPAERSAEAALAPFVVINPIVANRQMTRQVLRWEGCLSIPGLRAAVPRWVRIRYSGRRYHRRRRWAGRSMGCMPMSCSTRMITWTASSTRCASRDFSTFGFSEELARFPHPSLAATPQEHAA